MRIFSHGWGMSLSEGAVTSCGICAPYRGERTPSFRVNVAKQLWYDFGLGKGGDIFTLAGEFLQSDDFMDAGEVHSGSRQYDGCRMGKARRICSKPSESCF